MAVPEPSFLSFLGFQREFDSRLKRILEKAAEEAAKLIAKSVVDPTFSEEVRASQYQERGNQITQVLEKMWGKVQNETIEGMFKSADIAGKGTINILRTYGKGIDPDLFGSFVVSAEHVVQNVQSRLLNNIDLSKRVYNNVALSSGMVDDVVNNGIVLGKSAREIAQDVRKHISPRTPGGVSYAAQRLGRTEINNAFHRTQTESYVRQPWVRAVKWQTSGSHPRPDICDSYAHEDHDGLGPGVFEKGNVPGKPHPQCLCHLVPITVSREEFLDGLLGSQKTYAKATRRELAKLSDTPGKPRRIPKDVTGLTKKPIVKNEIKGKARVVVDEALLNLETRFPKATKTLGFVRPVDMYGDVDVMAEYAYGGIEVNDIYANNLSKWRSSIKKANSNGFVVMSTPEETIYHEFGHHMYNTMTSDQRLGLDVAFHKNGISPTRDGAKLSDYATSDRSEFISEAFTSYMKNDGNKIGVVVGAYFEEVWG